MSSSSCISGVPAITGRNCHIHLVPHRFNCHFLSLIIVKRVTAGLHSQDYSITQYTQYVNTTASRDSGSPNRVPQPARTVRWLTRVRHGAGKGPHSPTRRRLRMMQHGPLCRPPGRQEPTPTDPAKPRSSGAGVTFRGLATVRSAAVVVAVTPPPRLGRLAVQGRVTRVVARGT
jgi:hypothetical protein